MYEENGIIRWEKAQGNLQEKTKQTEKQIQEFEQAIKQGKTVCLTDILANKEEIIKEVWE